MLKFFEYEQHLSQRATEVRKQMTELSQLREPVRLAEAAKALQRLKRLACNPVDSNYRSVCRTSTARLASAAACHVLTRFLTVGSDSGILLSHWIGPTCLRDLVNIGGM
jgi:hypothetical protein